MTLSNGNPDISNLRLQCQHVPIDQAPDTNPRRYSVTLSHENRMDFAVLDVCRDCDALFSAGASVKLNNDKSIRLPERSTPVVREIVQEISD